MKRIFTAAAIAAVSAALTIGLPATAQEQTADAVMTELAELGMETDGLVLTEEQVLSIQAILSDASYDEAEKVAQIEAMVDQ